MLTFQDFQACESVPLFLLQAISEYESSDAVKIAKDADLYDRQKNKTINDYLQVMWTMSGSQVMDFTASNSKIASNFFHRLNTQRNTYLLGNGVFFQQEQTKDALGKSFDNVVKRLGYYALIHGVSYGFWNVDELHCFKCTEFVPLLDEYTGALRAGIRFWQLDDLKPLTVVLYEEDGYTTYQREKGVAELQEIEPKKAYVQNYEHTDFEGDVLVGEENYSTLPVIPMYGNQLKQSTLIGMQRAIDSYDLIRSGFANDLTDCSQIYWLIENAAGMDESDLARFRDRLKIQHIGAIDTADGATVTPYTQDIPYQARKQYLDDIRAEIYEGFGALDVHTIAAGATNDHIDAAYQPMDEEADDFEYQVTEFIDRLLKLLNIEDEPTYKRNRISNQAEQTQMVLSAAEYLDEETVLNKLPFITVDEVQDILKRKDAEDMERFSGFPARSDNKQGEDEQIPTEDEEDAENG